MKKLLFFLLFPFFLHAAWDPLFSEDEDPALFEHVNVITGSLNLFLQDTVVQGSKPIPIFRTYTSAGALERTHDNQDLILKSLRGGWKIQGGWTFFPHADLLIESARKHQDFRVYLAEPNGNVISYSYSHRESSHTIFLKPEVHSGQISGILTARTHPKNNLLRINLKKGTATLFLPSGGKRFYKGPDLHHYDPRELHKDYYHLISETLPSGHHLIYSYDDKEYLHQITLLNPSKTQVLTSINIDIERAQSPFHFRVTTSDNKTLNYYGLKAKERDYIHEVRSDCRPSEKSDYSPGRKGIGARIERFSLDGRTLFTVKYHSPSSEKKEKHWAEHPEDKEFQIDKVERIEATVGIPNEVASVGYFLYERTHTDVYDHSGYLTRYHHNGERLGHIEYFAEQNRLHSILKFLWDGSNLKAKVMLDGNGQALFSKTFRYDAAGNVIEEAIWGNLTGALPGPYTLRDDGSLENAESSRKRYEYEPEFNVPLLEEEEGGLSYRYAYRQGTDLLVSKFTYGQGEMLKREFYYYNVENLLVAEVTDDGKSSDPGDVSHVNVRLYKRYDLDPIFGIPRSITESYWNPHSDREHQLKKVKLSYTPSSQVHTESIYDGEGIYRYTLVHRI